MSQPEGHRESDTNSGLRGHQLPNEVSTDDDFGGAGFSHDLRNEARNLLRNDIPDLPIDQRIDEILESVASHRVTIVQAETGAGKTLRVPRALAEAGYKVVVTEPRIIAAKGSAARAAEEHDSELGSFIGYRTALYRNDSPNTRLLYCTDGLELVRTVMSDGEHRDLLVIDEIHEWNQHMEILLAWSKQELQRNPDFRLVIMSATMDHEDLAAYFDKPNVIQVAGRTFPVKEQGPGTSVEDDVKSLVRKNRNVLVFQPGKREIEECITRLHQMRVEAEILPLHGSLTLSEQDKVFEKYDRPVVVVATNVAQTSITIPYIDAVVDTGLARRVHIVDETEGLYKEIITQADREQRKGRAGRTKPGIYIDHCPVPKEQREPFGVPELLRIRPEQVVLQLLRAGIDIEDLKLYHQPPEAALRSARKLLFELGAIDSKNRITDMGERMADMPVSPIGARMLLEAEKRGVLAALIPAVAVYESGNITDHQESRWKALCKEEEDSDLLAQAQVLEEIVPGIPFLDEPDDEATTRLSFEWGLDGRALRRALEMRKLLMQRFGLEVISDQPFQKEVLLKCLASGLVGSVYKQSEGFPRWYSNNDDLRELTLESAVQDAEWAVGVPFDLDVGMDFMPKMISLLTRAQRINPNWLPELAPHLSHTSEPHSPQFQVKKGQVVFQQDTTFNGQRIATRYLALPDHPQSSQVFCEWLADLMLSETWNSKANKYTELREVWESNRALLQKSRNDWPRQHIKEFYLDQLKGQSELSAEFDFSKLSLRRKKVD